MLTPIMLSDVKRQFLFTSTLRTLFGSKAHLKFESRHMKIQIK